MCLILAAINEHPDFPLILCGNRDEFYNRPTRQASFWEENEQIFAGRDLEKGGTWLGVTTGGKIAAVTNVRSSEEVKDEYRTRGEIITNFFHSDSGLDEYLDKLHSTKHLYQGYNTIVGKGEDFYYYSNRAADAVKLDKGIHVVSNAQLNTNWPKAEKTKELMKAILTNKDKTLLIEGLLNMLGDATIYGDDVLPDTGVGIELERFLSSIFISGTEYGTRASTVVLRGFDGGTHFIEQSYGPNGGKESKIVEFIECNIR
ncbi:NRDE family protein [bacterium LRH843]|nr:NRDE family protein [bacterium LRH843]